ncbi:hypothetical protein T265_04928 [Opisthorchis viverrini]|uniref:nicotinamidase n=1 Tax=Opisthorchis viverrini TaxID=6198 RepID=A0A074ZQU5_OPIVI|nr:hypothetical protein T265_04928 [Opisthorchis viverrini]KER28167.1 hypothetical protein T265_04928 [Opisthorchis viverrini]
MATQLDQVNKVLLDNQDRDLHAALQQVITENPALSDTVKQCILRLEMLVQRKQNHLANPPLVRECSTSANTTALLIVDVQKDFVTGSMRTDRCPAQMDAMGIIKPINYLCGLPFKQIYVSKDWHPRDHVSFHENRNRWRLSKNSKASSIQKIYDTITIVDSMGVECNQQLWPTHCVAESEGAKIHPKLRLPEDVIVIKKGTISDVESYSVFGDPNGREDTTLEAKLRASGIKVLVLCGIAFDFCVAASVMDASKRGYRVIVLEDACVGIDPAGIADARRLMLESGVHITRSTKIIDILSGNSTPLQHVLKWVHDQTMAQ